MGADWYKMDEGEGSQASSQSAKTLGQSEFQLVEKTLVIRKVINLKTKQ